MLVGGWGGGLRFDWVGGWGEGGGVDTLLWGEVGVVQVIVAVVNGLHIAD